METAMTQIQNEFIAFVQKTPELEMRYQTCGIGASKDDAGNKILNITFFYSSRPSEETIRKNSTYRGIPIVFRDIKTLGHSEAKIENPKKERY